MQAAVSNNFQHIVLDMPIWVGYLEYIIDKLFVSSFILNKIKDLPLGHTSVVLANIALFCIAFAYTMQLISTNYYQVHQDQTQSLLNYKDCCRLISLLGCIITWFCILNPSLWLPCFWLMCLNNFLWIYNETTRIEHPSIFPPTPKNQERYCYYVSLMTLAMISSAISNTLSLFKLNQKQTILFTGKIFNWALSLIGIHQLYASAKSENIVIKPSI